MFYHHIKTFPKILFLVIGLLYGENAVAQRNLKSSAPMRSLSSAEIQESLRKVQVLGSVLYMAAHPDDENTRLIAYLTNGRGYHTTYLSMTRGDGGQNLIGTEKGPDLGVLRTQELLAARNIDGGHQRFTRAIDFGYSKNPEETLEIWDREAILCDAVMTIRELRPDVIVTRFPGPEDGGGGHGHHTSSYILAREAFDKAADASFHPELGAPWQVERLMWNSWRPYWDKNFDIEKSDLLQIDIGEYNAILGMSYGEIASLARSQHKCQDFGTYRQRGPRMEYLEHKAGTKPSEDFFEGIDATWSRLKGGEKVGEILAKAANNYNSRNPETIVPTLIEAYQATEELADSRWKQIKQEEIKDLIAQCSGLWLEALTDEATACLGDSFGVSTMVLKRSSVAASCTKVTYRWNFTDELAVSEGGDNKEIIFESAELGNNVPLTDERMLALPNKVSAKMPVPTQPYWLTKPARKGIYQVEHASLLGLPETPAAIYATFDITFGTDDPVTISYDLPVVHKYVNRAVGEMYRPFQITPKVTVNINEKVLLFADETPQQVSILIKAHSANPTQGTLAFNLPEGWNVEPSTIKLDFSQKGEEMPVNLTVTPPATQSVGPLIAMVQIDGEEGVSSFSLKTIEYGHIPTQLIFPPSETRLVKIDIKKSGNKIGYIMGSGDEVPVCLEQVGYQVTLLEDDDITVENLKQYDAIVAGIRAYNTRKRMGFMQPQLLKYVEAGGTYIVQYNKSRGLATEQPGPYPITISRDRVTVEEAPVKMLVPDHEIFNSPNKITNADFDGWIQERGLYFPNEWDEKYTALTACNDPGETSKEGALLIAEYGKGHFIYTGYSWFRELPAGVPGAYRIFANMLSVGK